MSGRDRNRPEPPVKSVSYQPHRHPRWPLTVRNYGFSLGLMDFCWISFVVPIAKYRPLRLLRTRVSVRIVGQDGTESPIRLKQPSFNSGNKCRNPAHAAFVKHVNDPENMAIASGLIQPAPTGEQAVDLRGRFAGVGATWLERPLPACARARHKAFEYRTSPRRNPHHGRPRPSVRRRQGIAFHALVATGAGEAQWRAAFRLRPAALSEMDGRRVARAK